MSRSQGCTVFAAVATLTQQPSRCSTGQLLTLPKRMPRRHIRVGPNHSKPSRFNITVASLAQQIVRGAAPWAGERAVRLTTRVLRMRRQRATPPLPTPPRPKLNKNKSRSPCTQLLQEMMRVCVCTPNLLDRPLGSCLAPGIARAFPLASGGSARAFHLATSVFAQACHLTLCLCVNPGSRERFGGVQACP